MSGGSLSGASSPRRGSAPAGELALLAALVALALALRAPDLAAYAPTHWDAGLVWSGARWFASLGAEGHYSPTQAPPLVPALLALTRAAGGGPAAAVWTSVAASALAVVLAERVGRRLGPGRGPAPATGLVAAGLVATSGFHALYARTLLTEAVLVALVLATLLAALRYLEQPGLARLAAVAACAVLAQYTKYNGALAGVPLGVWLLWRAREPLERRRALGHAALLLGAVALAVGANVAAIARLGDLPWFVEHYTGYVGASGGLAEIGAWLVAVTPAGALALAGLGLGALAREARQARHERRAARGLADPGGARSDGGVGGTGGRGLGARWALVLGVLALQALFLARYTFYLRLLLPVAVLLLLPAARGLVALARWRPHGAARAGLAAAAVVALLVGVDGARIGARLRPTGWDGYLRATPGLRAAATGDAPILQLAQRHVWPPSAPPMVYGGPGLPNAEAAAVLAERGARPVVVVVDVHAFSKHGPRSLAPLFEELWAAYGVARVANPLSIEVLENNLERAEILALERDAALRGRWLSIHVLRAPADELARRLAAAAPRGR